MNAECWTFIHSAFLRMTMTMLEHWGWNIYMEVSICGVTSSCVCTLFFTITPVSQHNNDYRPIILCGAGVYGRLWFLYSNLEDIMYVSHNVAYILLLFTHTHSFVVCSLLSKKSKSKSYHRRHHHRQRRSRVGFWRNNT